MGVLDHVQGGRDLVDVAGHADAVDDALLSGQDVLVVVGALGVGHDRDLHGRGSSPTTRRRSSSSQYFQCPNRRGRRSLGCLVAELHVVDAGGDAALVDRLDELVVEVVVVDQAAVADGADRGS